MSAATAQTAEPKPLGEALDDAPMSKKHRAFWLLAALGILLDGYDFFVIGIVNPLIKEQYDLSATMVGLISSAAAFRDAITSTASETAKAAWGHRGPRVVYRSSDDPRHPRDVPPIAQVPYLNPAAWGRLPTRSRGCVPCRLPSDRDHPPARPRNPLRPTHTVVSP